MKRKVVVWRNRLQLCLFGALSAFGSLAFAGEGWDLASDWNPPQNPNGAWTYGVYDSGSFVDLTYTNNAALAGLGDDGGYFPAGGNPTDGFIYKSLIANPAYGIDPGEVSLEADFGTPIARWTAPASGLYNISIVIGGTEADEGPGFGNNFAQDAAVNIKMAGQAASFSDNSSANNVRGWSFTNLMLGAGTNVDAYVAWPGFALGGNTQTIFHVTVSQTPLLSITLSNNQAVVSWSPAPPGWTLQTNSDLSTTNWGVFTGTISTNGTGTTNSATIAPVGNLFFRLANP